MAMTFYRETFSIHVDNPGYGELYLAADGMSDPYSDGPSFGCTLAGDQLGRLLTAFTDYALTGSRPTTDADLIPPNATPEEARGSLPVVQAAVIIAAAGTDRYERLFPERDAAPADLLCHLCSHGTDFSDHETRSEYCDRHGHTVRLPRRNHLGASAGSARMEGQGPRVEAADGRAIPGNQAVIIDGIDLDRQAAASWVATSGRRAS